MYVFVVMNKLISFTILTEFIRDCCCYVFPQLTESKAHPLACGACEMLKLRSGSYTVLDKGGND